MVGICAAWYAAGFFSGLEERRLSAYHCAGGKFMRSVIETTLLVGIVAAGAFSQGQGDPEIAAANPNLVPQDFSVEDVPISIQVPFQLLVNGKEWKGHTVGWHIDPGSTIWLGLPGRGMYLLSLAPREGYDFQKSGAIRGHVITFQGGGEQYEIRTSGSILGSDKAWNLYMLHLPAMEMKGPLFGVDRLGRCTLAGLLR
jgi:hypothetical protein